MKTLEDLTIGDIIARSKKGEQRELVQIQNIYNETVGTYINAAKPPPLDERWWRCNYHLKQFVREAWPYVETHPYQPGWHIDAICDHLEAVAESAAPVKHQDLPEIKNLLVNIPPRCSKSIIASVMFPAWLHITWPEATFLYVSYSQALSLRDAEKARELMKSNFYQSRWGDQWKFSGSQGVKSFYMNTRLGYRYSTSVGASATGFGGDIVIGDDLHSAAEDHSETRAEIEAAKAFWRDVIPSRSMNPSKMCKIVVGQRIAVDDVSEMLMDQDNYDQLIIPMEFDHEGQEVALRTCTALGWRDPRFESGDYFLQPDRFTPPVVAEYKLMERRYSAQYQQNPQSEGTTLFSREKWRYFQEWPDIDWFDVILLSVDTRFKDEKDASSSYNAIQVWGKRGPNVFLLDRYFKQSTFGELLEDIVRLSEKWPTAYGKLVEEKANGPAIISTLKSRLTGIIPVKVGGTNLAKGGGSKYQRAEAVSWIQRGGNAWLPSRKIATWVDDYINNMFRFPAEPNDDTDATSQAWRFLVGTKPKKDDAAQAKQRREAFLRRKTEQVKDRQQRFLVGTRTGA